MNTNIVTMMGRIVQDIELKTTSTGRPVVRNTLAVDNFSKDKENATDFIPVVFYDRKAEVIANSFTKKGHRLLVSGRLHTRKYEAKDGSKRTAFEVIINDIEFVERKNQEAGAQQPPYTPQPYEQPPAAPNGQYNTSPATPNGQYNTPPVDNFPPFDEEIPF